MKTLFAVALGALCLSVLARSQDLTGDWQGTLDVNGTELHLVLHVIKDDNGLRATLDSPDQGANGIPVGNISVADSVLKFDVLMVGGSYQGHLSADGQAVEGNWSQAGNSLPLAFKRESAAAASPPAKKPGEPMFPGEETWQGTLDAGMAKFHLILHLAKTDSGQVKAAIDSVDQNAYGITVSSATEKDSALKLALPGIGASYEGRIAAGRTTIDGTWSQGGRDMPLVFTRNGAGPPTGKPAGIAGIWVGVLEGPKLRLRLHVSAAETGHFTGKLDSLDQGANGLECSNISLSGAAFHFEVPSVGGSYEGKLNAAGDGIDGTWSQNGATFTLNFKRADSPAAQNRPQ